MTKFVTDVTKSAPFGSSVCYASKPHFQARVDEFAHCDVAKHYAVYICAHDYIRSPALEFVGAFELEGEKAIGFLKATLTDEVVNSVIILIFE